MERLHNTTGSQSRLTTLEITDVAIWISMDCIWPIVQAAISGEVVLFYGAILWAIAGLLFKGLTIRIFARMSATYRFIRRHIKLTVTVVVVAAVLLTTVRPNRAADNDFTDLSDCCKDKDCPIDRVSAAAVQGIKYVNKVVGLGVQDGNVERAEAAAEYELAGTVLFRLGEEIRTDIAKIHSSVHGWFEGVYGARVTAQHDQVLRLKEKTEQCQLVHRRMFGNEGADASLSANITILQASYQREQELRAARDAVYTWLTSVFSKLSDSQLKYALNAFAWASTVMNRVREADRRLGGCLAEHVNRMSNDLSWMDRLAESGEDRSAMVREALRKWAVKLLE